MIGLYLVKVDISHIKLCRVTISSSGELKHNMSEEFSLTSQKDGPVLVVRTNGYLNDLGAEQVDEVCTEHLDSGTNKIVINLEQSPLINSIGISILIGVIEAIEDCEVHLPSQT